MNRAVKSWLKEELLCYISVFFLIKLFMDISLRHKENVPTFEMRVQHVFFYAIHGLIFFPLPKMLGCFQSLTGLFFSLPHMHNSPPTSSGHFLEEAPFAEVLRR